MSLPPTPNGIQLRPSPVHGIGAFSVKDWTEGEEMGIYTGICMLKSEFRCQYGSDIQHVYWTKQNFPNSVVWIAKGAHRNFITYINESSNPNVYLKNRKLYALKNILADQELFLKYDSQYPRDYEIK